MALQINAPLSLSQVRSEFGGPIPINLSSYLSGGAYVSSAVEQQYTAASVPSSLPLNLLSLLGTSFEGNKLALATHFVNYRRGLIRYSGVTNSYPPVDGNPGFYASGTDNNIVYPGIANSEMWYWNNPNARYTNPITNNWTYSNGFMPNISPFFTIISAASGQIGNYGGIQSTDATTNGSPASLYWTSNMITNVGDGAQPSLVGNGYGISYQFKVYRGEVNTLTSSTVTTASGGGNAGTWTYQYVLPGRWTWDEGYTNFDVNRDIAIRSGEMHFTLIERGGNGHSPIPPPYWPDQTNFLVSTTDNWWYNGGGAQIAVNATNNTMNFGWNGSQGNYFPGGWTPRASLRIINWY